MLDIDELDCCPDEIIPNAELEALMYATWLLDIVMGSAFEDTSELEPEAVDVLLDFERSLSESAIPFKSDDTAGVAEVTVLDVMVDFPKAALIGIMNTPDEVLGVLGDNELGMEVLLETISVEGDADMDVALFIIEETTALSAVDD